MSTVFLTAKEYSLREDISELGRDDFDNEEKSISTMKSKKPTRWGRPIGSEEERVLISVLW
jgi:hypothetical protein